MTLATLMTYMALFDPELELESDGIDEARAITAINLVQDWFEGIAAGQSEILQRYSTLTTTANTEVSSWPTGLLRLDGLWFVDTDQTPNLPMWPLDPIYETGGHRPSFSWPETVIVTSATGKPRRYYATGPHTAGRIFWEPVPDAAHTIRYYGLIAASDYTIRTDVFAYPDPCADVFAQTAVKILRMGQDDQISELKLGAAAGLTMALNLCRSWWNDEAAPRHYADSHDT